MAQQSARAQMERLTELMGDAVLRGRTEKFKPPKYDGTGDVEYFLQQFNDCRDANGWPAAASVLHLRGCLEKSATECGKGATVNEVSENLRARFSLTVRQARERLSNIRREPGQNLYALGDEVERLVGLSYPDMRPADRVIISIDALKRALDHKGLNRHLLAVQCNTVKAVVRSAEDYFQASGTTTGSRHTVNALTEEGQCTNKEENETSIQKLLKVVEQNSRLLAQLASTQLKPSTTAKPQNSGCFRCGATDHWRRDCPKTKQPENGSGSQ